MWYWRLNQCRHAPYAPSALSNLVILHDKVAFESLPQDIKFLQALLVLLSINCNLVPWKPSLYQWLFLCARFKWRNSLKFYILFLQYEDGIRILHLLAKKTLALNLITSSNIKNFYFVFYARAPCWLWETILTILLPSAGITEVSLDAQP